MDYPDSPNQPLGTLVQEKTSRELSSHPGIGHDCNLHVRNVSKHFQLQSEGDQEQGQWRVK